MTSIFLSLTGAHAWATVDGPLTSGMVGIPVTIEYDEAWNGLTKNLMCRCSPWGTNNGEIRTLLNVGDTSTVAHEVMQPDMYLYLGVEGFSNDGTLVIPTTWARCGKIEYGANTCEDPSTDPELPIWNQLQTEVEQIKRDGYTQEQIDEIQAYVRSASQAATSAEKSKNNATAASNLAISNANLAEIYMKQAQTSAENASTSAGSAANLANGALQAQRAAEAAAQRAEYAADSRENVTEHRLKGHTMGVIGDSLSDRSRQVTQWFDWIATRAGGMEFVLDCVSGRRLMQFPSNTMSAACDVICVFGGTNDFNSAQPLGTIDDTTSETFYGAVYKLATELRTNYPKALLVFITPMSSAPDYNSGENVKWHQFPQMGGHTVQDFADAIREVCGYLHIPVVDLFRDSGLNYNYDDPVSPYFVSDKLHLTSRGQEVISYVIEDTILRHYIPDNTQTGNVVSLVSIDAVFTQGDTIITTDFALSQLRDMLAVTGTYSDGSTKPVTAYSLSGTLTEGTSTITVNYSGKTDTFDVEVSRSGTSIEPYVVTLAPDAEMADGYYFIPDGGGELNGKILRYSELVSIAGAQTIANDPDNVTYNWMRIYNLDKDQFAAGIIFYSDDMAIVGYGIAGFDSWGYYNQYPTETVSVAVGFSWVATDADGKVVTEQNAVPMIPEGAVYMRVLLASSTTTGNTLLIS